jgi:hypothetical protein
MVVVKFFVWFFTGEMTQVKINILEVSIVVYTIFCLVESMARYDQESDYSKYFNILWYPVRGIVLLNKFLDKLQEYDERNER